MADQKKENIAPEAPAIQLGDLSLSAVLQRSTTLRAAFAIAFDIDGVLVRGKKPLDHAKQVLELLDELSIPFILLTNGGGLTEIAHANLLATRIGVPIQEQQFIQSHTPFKQFANRYEDQFILALGGSGNQIRDLAEAGFPKAKVLTDSDMFKHDPSIHPFPELTRQYHEEHGIFNKDFAKDPKIAAIFIFSSPRDMCLDLQLCLDLLLSDGGRVNTRSGKNGDPTIVNCGYQQDGQPTLYFCNPDLEWATQNDQPRLAQGGFRAALEGIWSGLTQGQAPLQAWTCGKPTAATYRYAEAAIEKVHARNHPKAQAGVKRVYMVGDNPRSDVQGALLADKAEGAHPGWRSILVESGIYKAGAVPEFQPTTIKSDV